jgi:hypothetical protein
MPWRALGRRSAWTVPLAVVASVSAASGQPIDVERPSTLMVGSAGGGSRADRVDWARTGLARTKLPTSGLRVEWAASIGALTDRAPLVDARGGVYIVGTRGEVVALARDGSEKWRVSTGGAQPGPGALLSDDTVVFVATIGAVGVAVGVRDGHVTFKTRFGHADVGPTAPLALEDGGVVVATAGELAVLDKAGNERARMTLPEPVAAPPISALGKVVTVTATGSVWTWTPGAPEPARVASFGSAVDGSAALGDDHTLVAVTAGQTHLTAVDLIAGTTTTRAVSHGALWCGPPAMIGPFALVIALAPGGEFAMALDPTGRELSRTILGARGLPALSDAGPVAPVPGSVTPPIVDSSGSLAFSTVDGRLGVAPRVTTGDAPVELLTTPCSPALGGAARGTPPSPSVAGIAPLAEGVLVATCRSGTVFAVSGPRGSGESNAQHL